MTKLSLLIALAAASLATPTLAAERTPDAKVAYADLHIASATGQAALDRRISTAIDASCGVDVSVQDLAERLAAKHCVRAKQAEVAPARAAVLASRSAPERFATANR